MMEAVTRAIVETYEMRCFVNSLNFVGSRVKASFHVCGRVVLISRSIFWTPKKINFFCMTRLTHMWHPVADSISEFTGDRRMHIDIEGRIVTVLVYKDKL